MRSRGARRTIRAVVFLAISSTGGACLATVDESKIRNEADGGSADTSIETTTPIEGGPTFDGGPFRPGPGNVGLVDAAALTSVAAPNGYVVTEEGVVADLDIAGCVTIRANRVTLRNVRVHCAAGPFAIVLDPGFQQLALEEVDVSGGTIAAISPGNFAIRRADVHDFGEVGVTLASATLAESYVHAPTTTTRALVECRGGTDVSIDDDFLDGRGLPSSVSAVRVVAEAAPIAQVTVNGSEIAGAAPLVIVHAADGGTLDAPSIRITDNRIDIPTSGAVHDLDPGVVWSGNVDAADGGAVP